MFSIHTPLLRAAALARMLSILQRFNGRRKYLESGWELVTVRDTVANVGVTLLRLQIHAENTPMPYRSMSNE